MDDVILAVCEEDAPVSVVRQSAASPKEAALEVKVLVAVAIADVGAAATGGITVHSEA